MRVETMAIEGLHCMDCAARVQAAVNNVAGVDRCEVDHASGRLTVYLDGPELPVDDIARAVSQAGYRLALPERAPGHAPGPRHRQSVPEFLRFVLSRPETTMTAVAALLTMLGLAGNLVRAVAVGLPVPGWLSIVLFAAAIAVGGFYVARHAFQELALARSLGINALMVIAVAGAAAIGEWAEAAIVVVLFSLGEALEGYATERARRALSSLLDLAPPKALRLLPTGEAQEVSVEDLQIGERVRVRPGDRVSADGIVRAGLSAVDQSAITGESIPVEKRPGDEVFAGTVNTSGVLEVEVTHLAGDSTLSRMVRLVEQAPSQQAPVQRFIDRFARVYTPTVAAAALLVAVLPPLLLGQAFWGHEGWLVRALQMLVIACPCALVISTPVSLISAMTGAASRGVLVKGGRFLEALSRVRVFAFDKTGTLTEGRPTVTDVISVCDCGECEESCGLRYASAVESQSTHPMARALVAEAQARQLAIPPAEAVAELGGRGIEGQVNGAQVTVGSHTHFDEHFAHAASVCAKAEELAAQGKTAVLVRHDDEVCSLFGVADVPRAESRQVLAALHDRGMHTVMLTGDHPAVAAEIGRQVGVEQVRAGLLPEDKMAEIAHLGRAHGPVAMVGDGVNDAPALAQADVGIAMGGAGSTQAMETADVVLMGDDLRHLPYLFDLARRTRGVILTNVLFALGIKAAVFGLAAAGLATLWMAIVADVGASLAVILNGMRLRNAA